MKSRVDHINYFRNHRGLSGLIILLIVVFQYAEGVDVVTQLSGFYRSGQVFLTWNNLPDKELFYKVYRSSSQIFSPAQLPECDYLGYTNSESSMDHQLSMYDERAVYISIDSGLSVLSDSQGLFVATTAATGSYYYAVTTLKGTLEQQAIAVGFNSLPQPVYEVKSMPHPQFQQQRIIGTEVIEIYTMFISMKDEQSRLLMNKAGFIAADFALNRNHSTGNQPLKMRFHPGGSFFLDYNLPNENEMVISPEDYLPSGSNVNFWGLNEHYDVYDDSKNEKPPVTGINYNFMQQELELILDWAVEVLPIDTNRIYLEGSSYGSFGAFFLALMYPDRIAAVKLSVGGFNIAFDNDSSSSCTFNTGNINREDADRKYGTIATNLITNAGLGFYQQMNGGWYIHQFKQHSFPVIYSINGKYDLMVCWTEKTIYYDSVNANKVGGYYFWDSRSHNGSNKTWGDDNFNLYRYASNSSFPAFANCSADEDYGDGCADNGEAFGSVNGFLDWRDEIDEDSASWGATLFLRDLEKKDGSFVAAPYSCTVDVAPKRMQKFVMKPGDTLSWAVTHHETIIQSGQLIFDGSPIVIPGVPVFRDSVKLLLVNGNASDSIQRSILSLTVFPNILSGNTSIHWIVQSKTRCSVKVYDFQGRLVKTLLEQEQLKGSYLMQWNADDALGNQVRSGLYFIRLETGDKSMTRKCVITR